ETIDKAYRRAAIKFHPDKNRANAEAATKKFHQLSKAYETLSDPIKKLNYDNTHKARLAVKKRYEALNAKRKAMKEELEEGEKIAKQARNSVFTEESRQAKIELSKSTIIPSSSSPSAPPIYKKPNFNASDFELRVLNKMKEREKLDKELHERELSGMRQEEL
ncbi:963_t:CDS:2, partial [Acaulospora morrowiae]